MAVPNITNTDDIEIKVAFISGLNNSAETIITVASDDVVKVDSIMVANTNATTDYTVTLYIDDDAGGSGNLYYIAKGVNVPAATTLRIEGPIHLEESDLLRGLASTDGHLDVVASYVAISD